MKINNIIHFRCYLERFLEELKKINARPFQPPGYTNRFSSRTPPRPVQATSVSITDQDLRVSLIERLKYSLHSQNPPSLTWENIRLPAPTDSTMRLGLTCEWVMSGRMMPAVVSPATVAEPRQTLMMAAITQPRIRG